LAQRLDQKETFVKFGHEIVKYIDGKIYSHLMLPPILGIKNSLEITEALKKITGLATAETLSTPMSIPGYRLYQALQSFYREQRIKLVTGEVTGFDGESRQVRKIAIRDGETISQLRAKAFLLATGKYIGGGIKREKIFQESIFRLPVFVQNKMLQNVSPFRFTDPNFSYPQPFLQAGVRINSFGQPLDVDGEVVFDNLFAAGSVLADFDPSHERCAAGVSIVSGTVAAKHAKGLA
jgi:glycerol-3-phosphate dehydrogenase subunit B